MKIIIVGCGNVGATLTEQLSKENHDVTIIDTRSTVPVIIVFAIPKDTAKTISPTASSRATMGKSKSVRGPFALY